MYFDFLGFKYPITRTSYSFGRFRSNYCSNNYNVHRSTDTAFFIDPRIDKGKDRKNKIKNHHNVVINIFEALIPLYTDPVNQKDNLYKICIPLYLDITRRFKDIDKHDEAISHLSDPTYSVIFNSITQITNLENNNNSAVSQFMSKKEKEIKDAISNNPNISLEEYNQDRKFCYYNIAMIFKYYTNEIEQHRELEIAPNADYKGVNYYQLHTDPTHIIAVGHGEDIRQLKKLIDSKNQAIVSRFTEFIGNQNTMVGLINTLGTNMENVVHNAKILGLKGKCKMEGQLGFFNYYGFNRIIRFFPRRV